MIISASRRTDIPAFYSDWLINRLNERYVFVRNPFNNHQISKIDLTPNLIDGLVFWTKNPTSLMKRLDEIKDYKYYFQFTVTPYSKELEPKIPSKEIIVQIFRDLSLKIGSDFVIWRYDPILLSKKYDIKFHLDAFNDIASKLSGYTKRCVISFLDDYLKVMRRMKDYKVQKPNGPERDEIASKFSAIAAKYNITMVTCAEEMDLSNYGIHHGRCIDDKLISELTKNNITVGKDKTQRKECGCVASVDIGAYNTCLNGCLYCYANLNAKIIINNYQRHNPKSPLIIGEVKPEDKIVLRKPMACFDEQRLLDI
ncbi:DUF1848 domain-containing protein [candidate division TA06 bacterium]|uniref:DUF1848 domain-containing protein n=1 Tax=candidate division TA06 bacterium TaxID=2250710 RepID=A0A933MII7_UNCT6|nr:DUF1848 domain-containing protein [candidate division TA06 bacterium]